MASLEKCGNCGREIGRLEAPCVWKEHVVCPTCLLHLQNSEHISNVASSVKFCEGCGAKISGPPTLKDGHIVCGSCAGPPREVLSYSPTAGFHPPPERPQVQTIEKTSKKFKSQMLLAFGCMVIGIFMCCSGGTSKPGAQPDPQIQIGILMVFGGFVWLVTARVRAWWENG